jgi:hypothetical protein
LLISVFVKVDTFGVRWSTVSTVVMRPERCAVPMGRGRMFESCRAHFALLTSSS